MICAYCGLCTKHYNHSRKRILLGGVFRGKKERYKRN